MSLFFVDSMGHYTQAFMADKWDIVNTGIVGRCSMAQSTTSGRFGGGGVTFEMGTVNQAALAYMQKNFDGKSVIICGLAVMQTATQQAGLPPPFYVQGGRLLTFLDGSTMQVGLNILQSGQIQAVRNTNSGEGAFPNVFPAQKMTEIGISTNAIASSSFDFLEVKVTFATGTSGSIEILRNGNPFWTLTGVNTAISGVANCASIIVGGAIWGTGGSTVGQPLQAIVSDVHMLNTTAGSDPNDPVDFIGDRHWEPLFPLVDVTTDWTADPGPDNFANINTVPPDVGRNNNTEGVNDIDNYEFESALGPDTATVMFSYTMYLEKNTGGAVGVSGQSVSNAMPTNGTEFQVPNPIAFRQSMGFTDPDTAAPWTVAGFNLANHGYERTS